MSSNVDKVVKAYRALSFIPNLLGARFTNNHCVVNTVWRQRNLEKGDNIQFSKAIGVASDLSKIYESLPVDVTHELLSSISPSESLRAVLRGASDKQFIEIWHKDNLSKVVDLNAVDLHGDVYADEEFRTFEWSPDERKLMYVAEFKQAKSEPFYKRKSKKPKSNDEPKTRGEEYLFRQDWGEQLVGKRRSIIAVYNLDKDEVEVLTGVPEDICPAQVKFAPDGSYVVGIAYSTEPRKLGLIYCTNRPSTIFTLDFNGKYESLALENKSVKSPIFTPDGKNLLWLQRDAGGPHHATMTLIKAVVSPLADVTLKEVQFVKETSSATFYGLYNTGFAKRCFASDNRLLLSTIQKNAIKSYVVDLDSGNLTELVYNEGSQIVLDVSDDLVLLNRRDYLHQDKLVVCKLSPKQSGAPPQFYELTSGPPIEGLENCTFEYLDLVQPTNESVTAFSAIYLGPKTGTDKSVSLVVYPHGGPHSAFVNNFSLEASLFLLAGFAVVFINYRGSVGAGQASVEFLPGRIGTSDVADCILATQTVIDKYAFINPESLLLFGGSHGGFLVAHLSGQYPDTFKAVVARNPVIDVASMSVLSDIPDWCLVEIGSEYTQKGKPSDDELLKMRQCSPIQYAHKVKAPTMLQVGCKDLRVPSQQSLEYYTRLKANGATVKMNLYEDNHPLAQVPNELDNLINSVLWFLKYQ